MGSLSKCRLVIVMQPLNTTRVNKPPRGFSLRRRRRIDKFQIGSVNKKYSVLCPWEIAPHLRNLGLIVEHGWILPLCNLLELLCGLRHVFLILS
jgi:hypothetical protein